MKTLRYIILGALAVLATACVQDPDAPMNQPDLPTMSVDESSVTRVSMVVNGIFSKDMTDITEYGVEISETLFEAGGTYKTLVPQEIGADGFSLGVTGLTLNQTYFLRAFIGNGYSKLYSSTITQKTPESSVASISDVTIVDNQYFVATIEDNGGRNLEDVGFVWGEVNDRKSIRREKRYPGTLGADGKTITLPMSDIGKGTYYVLAYAEDDKDGTGFSRIPFELVLKDDVPPVKPDEPVPFAAVDMGLSVKWANMNLGATAPEEFGDYYAWGETETKSDYSWETYKWCNGTETSLTKYNTSSTYGTVDNKTVLDAEDDVAFVKLGGKWRMPTVQEIEELVATRENADYKWEWMSEEGYVGWLVTYLVNNNSLFFPRSGAMWHTSLEWVDRQGAFWSSSLYSEDPDLGYDFVFDTLNDHIDGNNGTNRHYGIPVRPVYGDAAPSGISASKYLTFTSEGTTWVYLNNYVGNNNPVVYYSVDLQNWEEWDYSELTFTQGHPLYLCGSNPEGFNKAFSQASSFDSYGDPFAITGDIMSLINKDQNVSVIPSNYCFYTLFKNCNNLTKAPELSATTLASDCYREMFEGCSSLSDMPVLPATTMAENCYLDMFRGCTSLTSPSALPATVLAKSCYQSMFQGCTSLSVAPELPATSLAEGCYAFMFASTGITSAPVLPATTLASFCYNSMFSSCTSLTAAPDLPAAMLTQDCYQQMFNGCTNLKYIKCLATNDTRFPCIFQWVEGVASTGTFVKSSSIGLTDGATGSGALVEDDGKWLWPRGASGIPAGWTVEDEGGSGSGISPSKYLTFTSEGTTKVSLTNTGGNAPVLYYSMDANNWEQWDYSELSFSAGSPLYICGDNPNGFSTYYDKYSAFSLSGNLFSVSGSVMSLLNHEGDLTSIPSNYCFYRLFSGCSTLMSAPDLPATSLKNSCYQEMFGDCSGLTVLPGLPATSLAQACYYSMFLNCSGVTAAPALPATSIPNYSYRSMFAGCTSLTTAPELSATSFSGFECYEEMFKGCTSLESAPELPATLLTNACYAFMFEGCTSLITAPALPATQLTNRCYEGMFKDCTSLTAAPELPATAFSGAPYKNMFMGCTSLVTAPALPATDLVTQCYMNMFTGCTSLTSAPALPATTLAVQCYYEMFSGCTALTKAPDLPAQKLVETCYSRMFQGCSNLNYVKCLATDISGSSCTVSWLSGVASIGTFVKSSKMNNWSTGDNGIPEGWTVRNDGSNEYFDFEDWN